MAEDRTDADLSGKGEPVTVPEPVDPFGALADEGAKLQSEPGKPDAAAETTPDSESVVDVPICQQGPCRHHSLARFPTGVSTSSAVIVADRHFCDKGVVFPEKTMGGRVLLGTVVTLPTECSSWSPVSNAELDEQGNRRIEAQDRAATRLAAEAALGETEAPEDTFSDSDNQPTGDR